MWIQPKKHISGSSRTIKILIIKWFSPFRKQGFFSRDSAVFLASTTESVISSDVLSWFDGEPLWSQLADKIFICFSSANRRSFVDSFLIRFIAHKSTKISDKYEGLTEGRKSAIRWDLEEDLAGDSISILRLRFLGTTGRRRQWKTANKIWYFVTRLGR